MISVDLDGTLNNVLDKWLEYISDKEKRKVQIEEISEFHHPLLKKHINFIKNSFLYDNVSLLDNAKEFMNFLTVIDDVQIVSVTLHEHFLSKKKFVERHFPGIRFIPVKNSKLPFCKNSLLIDDCLDNVKQHIELKNGDAIVFTDGRYRYNQTKDFKRYNYEGIMKYLIKEK